MSTPGFVLSIFSSIDLLGMSFEDEGYCVVGFIDTVWGRDVRKLHPPPGVFDGVIGGPPCQPWTRLQFLNPNAGKGLEWVVNEYARVVDEARPAWFLMEEVPLAPMPLVPGYHVYDVLLRDEDVGGLQPRQRRFSFGTPDGRMLMVQYHENGGGAQTSPYAGHGPLHKGSYKGRDSEYYPRQSILADGRAVPVRIGGSGKEKRSITTDGRTGSGIIRPRHLEMKAGGNLPHEGQVACIADACEAMGLPRDFTDKMPFTLQGKRSVIGNGVPQAMGRAIARAVRRATP